MAQIDKKYHELLQYILDKGRWYNDPNRKRVRRIQIPSYTFEHDLTKGFPAITTKKLAWKSVVGELLWFLRGDTNIKYLLDNNINIWNKDAYNYYKSFDKGELDYEHWLKHRPSTTTMRHGHDAKNCTYKFGDCGRIYGAQWRSWQGNNIFRKDLEVDQISNLLKNLKNKPLATDHIVTAWNSSEKNMMALPPCHNMFQINAWKLTNEERSLIKDKLYPQSEGESNIEDKWLKIPKYGFELVWNQRSVDTFLGLPFNIASYGLLAHIIGKLTNMVPMSLKGTLNNVHIYDNSIDAVKEQLSRDVNKYNEKATVVDFHDIKDHYDDKGLDDLLNNLDINENFKLKNYESYPSIKVEMLERD